MADPAYRDGDDPNDWWDQLSWERKRQVAAFIGSRGGRPIPVDPHPAQEMLTLAELGVEA